MLYTHLFFCSLFYIPISSRQRASIRKVVGCKQKSKNNRDSLDNVSWIKHPEVPLPLSFAND